MPDLTIQNIEQISRDVRREDINFSHLLEDLIDHVCCDVEYEMQNGLSYSEAYRRVKQKMGSRRIKEIQEETLYLVDTKYRIMKKTMKISGIAGTIMFGFAAVCKIQHWPLAGYLMTLGALILAFIFLPSALSVLWKETHNRKRIFLFISAFFTGILYIFGILFKIQHWPAAGIILGMAALCGVSLFIPALLINRLSEPDNRTKRPVLIFGAVGAVCYITGIFFKIMHWPLATVLMVTGVVIICFIVFPWYTRVTWKDEKNVSAGFIFIVISLLLIILPGALVNLSLQRSYESGFFTNMEQQQIVFNSLYDNNKSRIDQYHDSLYFPEIEQLHSKTTSLLSLIGNIQAEMVAEAEGDPGVPAVDPVQIKLIPGGQEIQYNLLTRPFHPSPVRDFLLPGCSARQNLEAGLKEYMNFLSEIIPEEDLQKLTGILQLSDSFSREMDEARLIPLMTGLHDLLLLKSRILALESYALSVISKY